MKTNKTHIIPLLFLGTTALGLTAACTDDAASDQGRTYTLRLSLGSTAFPDVAPTRALPTGFVPYDEVTLHPIQQIQTYFTYRDNDGQQDEPFVFTRTTEGTWSSRLVLKSPTDGQPYRVYGFLPREAVGSATIEPLSGDYAGGAVLHLNGINTVTASDVCVIVGVKGYDKDGDTDIPDMAGQLGSYTYAPATDGENIYLLVDHIYAGMQVRMKVDEDYNKLRKIKLKSIELKPGSDLPPTVNATVKLTQGSGTPVVTFDEPSTARSPQPAELRGVSNVELSADWSTFQACVYPTTALTSSYTMKTTYDVYDRKGNLIRENQEAQNALRQDWPLERGQRYTVNITVKPTYLYILSEPDLDSPTFTIND